MENPIPSLASRLQNSSGRLKEKAGAYVAHVHPGFSDVHQCFEMFINLPKCSSISRNVHQVLEISIKRPANVHQAKNKIYQVRGNAHQVQGMFINRRAVEFWYSFFPDNLDEHFRYFDENLETLMNISENGQKY